MTALASGTFLHAISNIKVGTPDKGGLGIGRTQERLPVHTLSMDFTLDSLRASWSGKVFSMWFRLADIY